MQVEEAFAVLHGVIPRAVDEVGRKSASRSPLAFRRRDMRLRSTGVTSARSIPDRGMESRRARLSAVDPVDEVCASSANAIRPSVNEVLTKAVSTFPRYYHCWPHRVVTKALIPESVATFVDLVVSR